MAHGSQNVNSSIRRDLLAKKGDDQPLSDNSSLLVSGRLDSVDAVEIAVLLEETFNLDFGEIGFDPTMIDGIEDICRMLKGESQKG